MNRNHPAFAAVMTAALATAGIGASIARAQTVNDWRVTVDVVVQGLTEPRAMTYIGSAGEFLVGQRDGKVLYFPTGAPTGQVILDLAVNLAGDRGLLGIAADPDWPLLAQGYVYLYYSESATGADSTDPAAVLGNRLYRYTLDSSAPMRLKDPVLILDLPATLGPGRTGGVLRFGPDDFLYLVTGDQGRDGRLQNNAAGAAPDDTGVILRIDKSGRPADGNPFVSDGAMSRDLAYGVGSGTGLAFDPVTHRLWDAEIGPGLYDEVNLVVPGLNSGATRLAGPVARDAQETADLWAAPGSVYRDPDFSWAAAVAPAGLSFVASSRLGCEKQNDLLVADAACGNLYRFHPNATRDGLELTSPELLDHVADNTGFACFDEMDEVLYGSGFGAVTDMIGSRSGTVEIVSSSLGTIYRLSQVTYMQLDADGDGADDACDCAPANATALEQPGEVPLLRVRGNPTSVSWDMLNGTTGSGTRATIVSGDLNALRYHGDYSRACTLGANLQSGPLHDTRDDPPPGYGYYYMVRAANACGPGTYGDGSRGVGGGGDPRDALDVANTLPACASCAGRAGGAIISFRFPPYADTMRAWITDDAFIDQAKQFLAAGSTTLVPAFNHLYDGRDCDPLWTWHVDPSSVSWGPAAIEVCDGLPSGVEADKSYWLQLGIYCPWGAQVAAVDDQR